VTIDDFGTGYSSLSYLTRFPVAALKIDRAFVTRVTDGDENREVVRSIVALAAALGLQVVAEGVETANQADELRALGCPLAQGFFLARPLDETDATRLLTSSLL
jgi:EAL domain-containing protein (putative c-di-GMP-specific phosphodiesterase class I)